MKTFLKEYICFSGRMARGEFLNFIIAACMFCFFMGVILFAIFELLGYTTYTTCFIIPFIILNSILLLTIYAAIVRRLHDLNCSGWWIILLLLLGSSTIMSIISLLFLLFKKGTEGENRFGPDPLEIENDRCEL